MTLPPIYVAASVRTPIGRFGGGLKSLSAVQLGANAIAECVRRAGLSGAGSAKVDEVIIGHARQAGAGPNVRTLRARRLMSTPSPIRRPGDTQTLHAESFPCFRKFPGYAERQS